MENETNPKLELFQSDFSDEKKFESNLEKLFQYIFLNIFPNILNLPRIDFMNSLMTSVKSILEEQYSSEIYSNEKFFSLFLSVNKIFEKKYKDYNQILSNAWDNYSNENNSYFTDFKKHCGKTQEKAMHLCNKNNKNETGNYIIVFLKNEIKFLICEKCRKSYYANLFINFCQNCKCNYYSGLISQKENSISQLATYTTPHCDSIVNEKIPCNKCKNPLYYNFKDNMVECKNVGCIYKTRPNYGNWKCNICNTYFKSDIKLYNHFDLLYLKRIYGIALLIKQKAHPGVLPCCQDLDEKNLIFRHKKDCSGILYFWFLNTKIIVICEKCKAINYFNRFIWTCPNCGLHFRAKKEEMEEKIKKNLMYNLKKKFNIHIILGEEFLLDHSENNINNIYETINNEGHRLVRKRSFKEVLEQKRKGFSNDKTIQKESEEEMKHEIKVKRKFIPRNYNDNLIYSISSKNNNKITIEEETKPSVKKRKNYLFDRLLRNQFVPDYKKNNHFKRANSGAIYLTDQKNQNDEPKENNSNKNNFSGNRFRLRARSGYLKNELQEFLKNNKIESGNKIGKEKEEDKEVHAFIVEDKVDNNKKNMPPLPFRIKIKLQNNNLNYNQNKYKLFLEFQYEKQNNYKTPRMILINKNNKSKHNNNQNKKEESNNNIKRNLSDKIINKLNIDSFKYKISNHNNNKKNDKKGDKVVRKLEYKFNDDYNQKKTKNKTDSDEEKSYKDEKVINKNEETPVIIKSENIGFKNIRESKIKKDENKNNNNKDVITIENENDKKEKRQRNFGLYKRYKENERESSNNNNKKIIINSQPSDIISISNLDPQMDIFIENEAIKRDKSLYNSLQSQIIKILSKGNLPIFNIENYKIERQIGEGSFGLIYQVMNKKSYIKYAMKKIIANNLLSLETFQREFEIVHQNSHPNILDILGICIRCLDQTTYVLYVLMDLALHDWDFEIEQRQKKKNYYTEKELISILKQISSALFYLQRVKRTAHRDVKPENILVFNDGIYKLGDFGEAKINQLRRNNARSTIRGTEMYMSPALFKALQENKDDIKHDIYKSDVFSLGYCFVYAATLDFKIIDNIRNLNNDFKVRKILQRILFLRYSKEFIELIYKMISVNEDDRVDFIGLDKLLKEQNFK